MKAKVTFAWWLLWLYLPGVKLTAYVTGLEPDWDKVCAYINRGMKVRIVKAA